MKKGQTINIDWTVGLSLLLLTSITAIVFLTSSNIGPDQINSLEAKNIDIQGNIEDLTAIEGRKIPVISKGPVNISKIPVDREYTFPSNAYNESGGGDIPAELNISQNNIVTVTDAGNLSHFLVYFTESVSKLNYSNDIETDNNWINNSNISMEKDGSGINSLKINSQELLNPDADLGSGSSSIYESNLYAETLSGDLRLYNNSPELILDDRTQNLTFNLDNLDTLYWYENDTTIPLTGSGTKAEGDTKGFTIASTYGISFIGDMVVNVSKPDSSTVRAEIDADRIRIRLHDSDYTSGKERIKFYDEGYILFGASRKFSAPYESKIKQLNSASKQSFEDSLDTEDFNYNIGFGSWLQKLVEKISEWNKGEFNATSASRNDNSGNLGIGYRNGTQTDSLVGYWRMDRAISGDGGTVKDYSGEGNDGTTQNSVDTGKKGIFSTNSTEYVGSDEKIIISNTPELEDSSFTFSFWFKGDFSDSSDTYPKVFNHFWGRNDVLDSGFRFDSDSTDKYIQGFVYNNSYSDWAHIAVSANQSEGQAYFYENGNLIHTDSFSEGEHISSPSKIRIGNDSLDGQVDEFIYYKESLTQTEVTKLYFNGKDNKFKGEFTLDNQTDSFQSWQELTVDADVPSGTSLEAFFESLDEDGDVIDSHVISIQAGENIYNIDSDSSTGYQLTFRGNSTNPEKSWEVNDYNLKYGPELKRGKIIPLDTSAVVSDRSSALIERNGSFSEVQNRVVLWP